MTLKLWHDDWCGPPDKSWVWAKTNAAAIAVLENGWPVAECSLDHDLGLHDVDLPDDPDEFIVVAESAHSDETGEDLARWMIENRYVPPKITIHSWNNDGAVRMARLFNDAGFDVYLSPRREIKKDGQRRPIALSRDAA